MSHGWVSTLFIGVFKKGHGAEDDSAKQTKKIKKKNEKKLKNKNTSKQCGSSGTDGQHHQHYLIAHLIAKLDFWISLVDAQASRIPAC